MLVVNISKTCRACLEECATMISIYEKIEEFEPMTTMDLLKNLNFINISDDTKFPQVVCADCYKMIKSYYTFTLLCQYSEKEMLKYFDENTLSQSKDWSMNQETWEVETEDVNENQLLVEVEKIKEEEISIKEEVEEVESTSFDLEEENQFCADSGNDFTQLISNSFDCDHSMEDADNDLNNDYIDMNDILAGRYKVKIICCLCNSVFHQEESYFKHSALKHNSDNIFESKTITSDSIVLSQKFYCEACKFIFHDRRKFIDHIIYCHNGEPYECTECNFISYNLIIYNIHARTHHEKYPIHKSRFKIYKNDFFLCHICGKMSLNSTTGNRHIKAHTGEKSPFPCAVYSMYQGVYIPWFVPIMNRSSDDQHNNLIILPLLP